MWIFRCIGRVKFDKVIVVVQILCSYNTCWLIIGILLIFWSFSIDKLNVEKEFAVNLSFQLKLEGVATGFTILSDTRIPIPLCNENASFSFPGDGSIAGFVRGLGQNYSDLAIAAVFRELGLEVRISSFTIWIIFI